MTNDDDFLTPTEDSETWIAELRRRCPTPEETDALCDRAERLAAIERQVRDLLDALGDYPKVLDDPLDVENVRNRLRAILDPET